MVGWWLYYPKMHEKSIRKQAMQLLNEGDNSSFFGVKKMVIGQGFIQIVDEDSSESMISRQNLKEIKIYENQIILYLSAVQGLIIPIKKYGSEHSEKLSRSIEEFSKNW